jgi:hypothetical protein
VTRRQIGRVGRKCHQEDPCLRQKLPLSLVIGQVFLAAFEHKHTSFEFHLISTQLVERNI